MTFIEAAVQCLTSFGTDEDEVKSYYEKHKSCPYMNLEIPPGKDKECLGAFRKMYFSKKGSDDRKAAQIVLDGLETEALTNRN